MRKRGMSRSFPRLCFGLRCTDMNQAISIPDILSELAAGRELAEAPLRWWLTEMMAGRCGDADAENFLVALKKKGETEREIGWAAQVLREHMICWDPGRPDILDTCGTGGDGSGTFNISTATALVVAASGVPVVKHGNRSVSSKTGSADVLQALGIKIDGDADFARRCLAAANFAFCFAPQFHPALKHVAAVRRKLGVPTIFNCLGPLANPAGAKRQLIGVGRSELLDLMAGALAQLGTEHALIVCSSDGLDEVSLSAPTLVREIRGAVIRSLQWTPVDFGLEICPLTELSAPHAAASADMIKKVLAGEEGAAYRIVLANAAAALMAAGRALTLLEGVELARDTVKSGRALQ